MLKGIEVDNELVKLETKYISVKVNWDNGAVLKIKKIGENIIVSNEIVQVIFNKNEGRLTSYIYKGNELLKEGKGPKPNFWRAVTDNDSGNKMYNRNIEWKKASLFSEVISLTSKIVANNLIELNVIYQLPGVDTQFHSIYQINGKGILKIENVLDTTTYKADIPRIGMRMQLPFEYNNMTYFGRGP